MLDAARAAIRHATGRTRADLDREELLALGLTHLVEIVGEASKYVSPATQAAAPTIPWSQIARTRDRLIHGYFAVNLDRLWEIVTADLPPLVVALEKLRASIESGAEPAPPKPE